MKKQDNSCLYLKLFPLKSLEKKSNVEHKWIIKHACQGEEAMHPCFCCLTCRITAEAAGDRKLSSIPIQQKWQACRHFIWFFFQLGSVNKCLKLFISTLALLHAVSVFIGQPNGWISLQQTATGKINLHWIKWSSLLSTFAVMLFVYMPNSNPRLFT